MCWLNKRKGWVCGGGGGGEVAGGATLGVAPRWCSSMLSGPTAPEGALQGGGWVGGWVGGRGEEVVGHAMDPPGG